jgi:SAM-dependent methyltransferase
MHLLARFKGPNGVIRVLEDPATGARLYEEGGVAQSRVLPGGEADVMYVRLMATLLARGADALLLGCGGGALASMLHRRGSRVTVVEVNPVSFQLARTFFWMPNGIECITADVREVVCAEARTFDAIGIDVGGPRFSYLKVLDQQTLARVRGALREGGRIAVNISLEAPGDPVPGLIADRLAGVGLEVWAFTEHPSSEEINAVILASARTEAPSELAAIAGGSWSLARLSQLPRSRRRAQARRRGRRYAAAATPCD